MTTTLPLDLTALAAPADLVDACEALAARHPAALDAGLPEWWAALACLDLTSLGNDDDFERVLPVVQHAARYPAGIDGPLRLPAAVCVWPAFVPLAREVLKGMGVRVATVAAAFPHGLAPLESRVADVRACAAMDLDEIDVVIPRHLARDGKWEVLYDEIVAFRRAADGRELKVILSTAELREPTIVYAAATVALAAGADFIKTSTGKEGDVADRRLGAAMLRALADFAAATGQRRGFKAAGGIRTAAEAAAWMRMTIDVLGAEAVEPDRFRIGASALYDDLLHRIAAVHA